MKWYVSPLGNKHALDEPSHAGTGLEVPDVGLHGPDNKRVRDRAVLAEDLGDRLSFLQVASLSSRAMAFDICGPVCGEACRPVHVSDVVDLPLLAGKGYT